jgi:hypothetical protein
LEDLPRLEADIDQVLGHAQVLGVGAQALLQLSKYSLRSNLGGATIVPPGARKAPSSGP